MRPGRSGRSGSERSARSGRYEDVDEPSRRGGRPGARSAASRGRAGRSSGRPGRGSIPRPASARRPVRLLPRARGCPRWTRGGGAGRPSSVPRPRRQLAPARPWGTATATGGPARPGRHRRWPRPSPLRCPKTPNRWPGSARTRHRRIVLLVPRACPFLHRRRSSVAPQGRSEDDLAGRQSSRHDGSLDVGLPWAPRPPHPGRP